MKKKNKIILQYNNLRVCRLRSLQRGRDDVTGLRIYRLVCLVFFLHPIACTVEKQTRINNIRMI
jgi:hypothetical protein